MRTVLALLLIAAPLSAQVPDSIVTETTTRSSVPMPPQAEPLAPIVEVDVQTDSIVAVMREMMADQAVRDAFRTCGECESSWAPGWFMGGLLLVGAGYVVSRFFEKVETTTITITQSQSQEQTVSSTTTRRQWPKKKPDDDDDNE